MSLEAALSLSIPELLQVLNKKLVLECTRMQEIRLPSGAASVTTLETEIECLKTRANELLGLIPSLRNLLQPVNRLPPEILSRIARHVPDTDAKDSRSIIPTTHVCRYWRKSIISTPENWTLICNGSFDLTKLSLERCKAAPLELRVDMRGARRNPGYFDIITPYIQNTRTLRLYSFSTMDELEQTLHNFPRSMPYLRSLHLAAGYANWDWSRDLCGPLASPLTCLQLAHVPLYPSFLRLGTLRVLTLHQFHFNLPIDTLLDFLEGNPSLERATLTIQFARPSLRDSQRRVAIKNRLQYLRISTGNAMDQNALISNIEVQKGAHLEIAIFGSAAGLTDVRSVVSAPHLLNLHSPTFMEYCPNNKNRRIHLIGPNGSFSFKRLRCTEGPFVEFPLLPLNNVRRFHLVRPASGSEESRSNSLVFPPLSLPALEMFSIKYEPNVSQLLSCLFSNPFFYPSLKTFAFLDCDLDESFMEKFMRFSCDRKETASAWLYHVVIVNSKGNLPSITSIEALRKHVSLVDVRVGKELPSDL